MSKIFGQDADEEGEDVAAAETVGAVEAVEAVEAVGAGSIRVLSPSPTTTRNKAFVSYAN